VFDGQLLQVFGILKNEKNVDVTLKAEGPFGPLEWKIPVSVDIASAGTTIHRLAARGLVRDVENNNQPQLKSVSEALDLAIRYSIISKYTSFVVVEKRQDATEGSMQLREVPVVLATQQPVGVSFGATPSFGTSTTSSFGGFSFGSSFGGFGATPTSSFAFGAPSNSFVPYGATPAFGAPPSPFGASSSATGFGASSAFSGFGASGSSSFSVGSSTTPLNTINEKMYQLVKQQKADGTWNLTQELSDLIQVSLEKVEKAAKLLGVEPTVWATSLAIAQLELMYYNYKDEWIILVEKALKTLSTRGQNYVKQAKEFLQNRS